MLKKVNFYIINLKKNLLGIFLCIFIVCLLIFSKSNISAAKSGLLLWANSVVPTLFPFFIAIELLNHTNIAKNLGKLLNKIMRPFFNVPRNWCLCFYYGTYKWLPNRCQNCYSI